MLRKLLLLSAGLWLAGPAWAEEPVPLTPPMVTCGQMLGEKDAKPVETGPLSRESRAVLGGLFDQLEGEWSGSMEEQICMLNGRARQYGAASTLVIKAGSGSLRLSGYDSRHGSKSRKSHRRSLFVNRDALRVDNQSRAGNVALLGASDSVLAFVRDYRIVRREQIDTTQPAGVLAGALVLSQGQAVPQAAEQESEQENGQGESQATQLHSQTRQERYYLELSGSNELTITQQYFQQGRYIGSNRWRLNRD